MLINSYSYGTAYNYTRSAGEITETSATKLNKGLRASSPVWLERLGVGKLRRAQKKDDCEHLSEIQLFLFFCR